MSITIDWLHVVLVVAVVILFLLLNIKFTEIVVQHQLIEELLDNGCNFGLP
jgi:hypothetical protein